MIDRLFTATLAFAILAAGTLAVGSDFFRQPHAAAQATQIVELPRVVIVAKRLSASAPLARTDAVAPLAQRLQ